jgi:signal transduction histidine kinase
VERRPRRQPLIAHLARGAELALVGLLGLFVMIDVFVAASAGTGVAWLVPLSGAVTTGAVAMRRQWLERGTAVAVACSLAVSLLALDHTINPSAADVAGLLVLTVLVTRLVARPEVLLYLLGTWLAVEASGMRTEGNPAAGAFVFAWFYACALAFGGYLRWLDLQRSQAAVAARRDERLDLARELHDLVAHYVTGIVVQAQAAQIVAERQPAAAVDALARIEHAGVDALGAMRRMVGTLRSGYSRPDTDPPVGPAGVAGLDDLVSQHNAAGIPVRLHLNDIDPNTLPPAVAAAIHRIVLESLTNVSRHAVDVTRVDVDLRRHAHADEIVVEVRDDGRDTGPPHVLRRSGGFGLIGMAERAIALGGTLIAGPAPAEVGWQVVARLPLVGRAATDRPNGVP